jgi:hypothetical protein
MNFVTDSCVLMIKIYSFNFSSLIKLFSDFTISQCNSVYWLEEKPHMTVEEAVNFSSITPNCSVSSRRNVEPFLTEEIMTVTSYRTNICHILT